MRVVTIHLHEDGSFTDAPVLGHELDHEVTVLEVIMPVPYKSLLLSECAVSLHLLAPDGTKGEFALETTGDIVRFPVRRTTTLSGRYTFSIKLVHGDKVATTGNGTFIIASRIDADESVLEPLAPSIIETMQADIAWLKSNAGSGGAFSLASAPDYWNGTQEEYDALADEVKQGITLAVIV